MMYHKLSYAVSPYLGILECKPNEDLKSNGLIVKGLLILNTDKTWCMVLSQTIGTHQRQATVNENKLNLKVGDKTIQHVSEAK